MFKHYNFTERFYLYFCSLAEKPPPKFHSAQHVQKRPSYFPWCIYHLNLPVYKLPHFFTYHAVWLDIITVV